MPDQVKSSAVALFQKSVSPMYTAITANAYNLAERLMRYNDFQEMEQTPEISSALDIYADETCAQDEKGRTLHIYSDNTRIKQILEDLFYDTLNIEFNMRPWTRSLCKFGDFFLYNDVHPDHGVLNAIPIPVNEIERIEGFDKTDPMAVKFRWAGLANRELENWEVTHMRLLGNDTFLPYGSSIIEPARRIWRQLILIEDAMLVYRVVRAPERRVFYIDVGNLESDVIPTYVEQQRAQLRTNQVVDKSAGRVDLRYNPMSVDEDFFIPVRGADTGTKIDTLAGGQNTAAVEDVAYIQKKLFAALKIPRAYLGYDELLSCLTGDTKVPLLSGKTLTMSELSGLDWSTSRDIWVYSADPATGEFRPGRVKKAWATKQVYELYHIALDNGEVVKCTANHPFLCRDGLYRRADELIVGQSLMPLYRKLSSKKEGDFQNGYEKVLNNATGKWCYTHRLVADFVSIPDDPSRLIEQNYVIHHIDCDKRNNSPENLVKMGKKAHVLYHSAGAKANLLSDSSRDNLRKVMSTSEYRFAHKTGVQRAWDSDNGIRRNTVAANNTKYKRKDVDLKEAYKLAQTCENRKQFYLAIGLTYTGFKKTCERQGVHHGSWLTNVFGNKRLGVKRNHTITSIEIVKLNDPIWVYDIEVDHHNFLIDQGVIVHNSKATLAQEDIRFSRSVNMIQRTIIAELNKLAIIHLYAHGFEGEDLLNFTLRLSNPSTVAQQQKLEVYRAKFEIAGTAPEGLVSRKFLLKNILMLNDDEIEEIDEELEEDAARVARLGAAAEGVVDGGGGGGSSGGGMGLAGAPGGEGGGEEDIFGGPEGGGGGEPASGGEVGAPTAPGEESSKEPEEENAGEEPEEEKEPNIELLTSGDDPNDKPIKITLKPGENPVKANSQLSKHLYNRARRRTHGASKTHMPDYKRMTGNDSPSMKDPFDVGWMKGVVSNPMGEGIEQQDYFLPRPVMSRDALNAIRGVARRWGITDQKKSVLISESVEEDLEIDFEDLDIGDGDER
jgi:hypothetical protein